MLCLISMNNIVLLIWHHRVSEQTITIPAPETNVDAKALSELANDISGVKPTATLLRHDIPSHTGQQKIPKAMSNKPTVMLGMATRDRPGYVQLTLKALKESTHQAKIFIFDDASTKMSLSDLNRWIDNKAQSVVGVKTKKGPDAMARHILEKFVSSKFDVLVLLDSDQVVAPSWWSSLQKGLRKSTGLLSLYRSGAPTHKSLSCSDILCQQPSMGNAGTVWRRDLAKRMLAAMPNRDGGFDWGWSEWCTKNKVPMEALKESAVLHIGMHGSWSHETSAEKAVGFPMGELSAEVRQRAEHFLKGAKPTVIAPSEPTNKKLQMTSEFINEKLPTIHAVILVRLYDADKPGWSRYELEQWVEYMLYAGVTKIYLYDAHMTEDESLKEWSDKWAHVLVYHDWGQYNHPYTIQGTQVRAYQHAIDTYGTLSDWQIAYDIDEYPFSTLDQSFGFLQRKVAELSTDNISELSLQNFVFVGKPCHGKERVIRRIVRRSPTKTNNLDKSIYRPTRVRAQVHHSSINVGLSKDIDPSILRTNHYWGLRRQNWGVPCESSNNCWSEVDMIKNTVEDRSALIIGDYLDSQLPEPTNKKLPNPNHDDKSGAKPTHTSSKQIEQGSSLQATVKGDNLKITKKWPTIHQNIAFLHIGKAGGTSVDSSIGPVIRKLGYHYIGGRHFDWSYVDTLKDASVITMLREPVSRAVSHFHFAKTLGWTRGLAMRHQTLTEYFKDPQGLLDTRGVWQDGQAMVSWLSGTHIANWVGIPASEVSAREKKWEDIDSVCRLAAKRLRETIWFGILDDVERSMELLTYVLDSPQRISLGKSNSHHHASATEDEKKMLGSLMPADIWLFKYARLLFEARWNAYKTGVFNEPEEPPFPKIWPCESTRFSIDCIEGPLKGLHWKDPNAPAEYVKSYTNVKQHDSTKNAKVDYALLWVIPAFKRAWSLDLVLQSLASQTNILVSKDADSAEIDSVLEKYAVEVINHPWSCSRHPNQFPAKDESLNENYKGDTYGNPRSPWTTCLKHHWWWMMKQAWARKPERVCVLEDDTVIHPQAFEWLDKNKEGNVKLTLEEIAVPWCMSAKEWQAIVPKTFCEHDDYNWDQTIAWMKEHGHGSNEAVVPSVSLSMHVGDCGGWDAGGRDKKCTSKQIVKIRANVEHWLHKPVAINTIKKKWLTAHSKPNGGWGHPKDWAHCTDNSPKYVVVIPSVKRNNDEYLQKTLQSLNIAKPLNIPVILVNGNQPPEEHTYLRKWCVSHELYKCIKPTQVPESLIKDVISNDKRGDTEHFLRWRTTETEHALFGLREALKLHTEYIIWMQDDVIINKDLFASLSTEDVVCLRDGKDYCGAVAYLFSRNFVSKLIPKIEANKLTMPIDWIIFDPRLPEAKYNVPKRIPLVTHIGKKSSKVSINHLTHISQFKKYAKWSGKVPRNMDEGHESLFLGVFKKYAKWSGKVPRNMDEGHESLFLGVFTACKAQGPWASPLCTTPSDSVIYSKYPLLGDHTFEWQDMISSILTADKHFNMIELGAGWAKWIVDGTAIAKKEGITKIVAIGVEAQPIHCQWGKDHIITNKMEKECFMICAAVGEKDGKVQFPVDDTGGQYGNGIQMLLDGKKAKKIIEIDEISLCSVIARFQGESIDFLSLDVQSYEHAILKPTPKTLECLKRVRLIHISLHRVEENDARQFVETFVGLMGWKLVRYFPLETPSVSTQYGPISFHDGVITFVNTHLSPELVDMLYHKDNIHLGSYTAHSFKSKSTADDWSDKNKITDIHYQQSLCELIPLICECHSKEQQDITLKNILSILTLDQLHYFIRTMSRTDTNIHGHKLALFAPKDDIGLKTVISEQKKDEYRLRQWNLKPEDLFVDVGSNLGVVSILAALQYPDIRILSIEASPPTWFYQQLNLLCNIPSHQTVKSICVGLGKTDGTTKMMYRPSSTTSTRNWNPNSEYNPSEDIEFDIHISSLDTVLAETSNQYPITMMKLDCEGCEYEFLPSLSGQTKIKDMVGEIHYGFMAQFNKEPSAEKIMAAHNRVCSYSYFKDTAKECCYFDKSNDKLCNDYTTWAEKNRLALYQTDITTIKNIQTSDLFAAIDYNAPENKGPWKQGWDYDYDGRFKDGLTVHVVPHSHNDPGWIKTYHTYYSTQTRHILDTVVAALTEDPRRTFIWAEISYFSLWWGDATQQQKEQAKKLVAEKRLDFITGGWVMNDEASVTARATRWHLQEGREWLQKTFGITPQYSWAIDPFGHSAGQAQVLKELGYKGMLIQRVHYAVKKQLAEKQQLEFQWQTPVGDIFTHMMPFYSYDGPHTCGPDPSVCCQFDFARINGGYSGCPWHKPSVPITDSNVAERSKLWLDQVYKKAMLYRGKNVLIPVGDDFRYQTMDEAHKQFTNYQKMFDWIGANIPAVKVSFSTLTRYFDAVRNTKVPRLEGSFFPYSDRVQDYWTGYFNSRIFYKGYDRLLESLIAAVESKCPTVDIHLQKRALGIFQHHDGITGTAKSHVVQDYYQTMQKAVTELKSKLKTCLDIAAGQLVNPLSVDTPTMKADEIRPYEEDACVSVPAAGLQFVGIKIDEHGRLVQINDTPIHESLVWRSNKPGQGVAGAYLMSVTSKEDILQPIKHTTCIAKRYKQVETTFDMLKRRIRVYNDGTIEFIYDVDIHARNNGELWAMYTPEWSAERLCSDLHGLTWECHVERKDAPLQAKFWPMPTMAWLASSSQRMTFTGAQPTGVGFHEGALTLMLDRRGDQDDARGLGQGITDSRPVEMRFGVLMETENLKERASEKALLIRLWMLNPAIEIV